MKFSEFFFNFDYYSRDLDIDECAISNPCGPSATCSTPTIEFRECKCYEGYHFKSLGVTGVDATKLGLAKTLEGTTVWNSADDCIREYFFSA